MYWPSCPPTVTCKGACSLDQPSLGLLDSFSGAAGQGFPGSQDKEVAPRGHACFLICLFPHSVACSFQNVLLSWSGQHDSKLGERGLPGHSGLQAGQPHQAL